MSLLLCHKTESRKTIYDLINKYFPAEQHFFKILKNKTIKLPYCCLPVKHNLGKLFFDLINKNFPVEQPFSKILIVNRLSYPTAAFP